MTSRKFDLGKDPAYGDKSAAPKRKGAAPIDPATRLPGRPPVLGPLAKKI